MEVWCCDQNRWLAEIRTTALDWPSGRNASLTAALLLARMSVTTGFDFAEADQVPPALFNRVLWAGLMEQPYPTKQ